MLNDEDIETSEHHNRSQYLITWIFCPLLPDIMLILSGVGIMMMRWTILGNPKISCRKLVFSSTPQLRIFIICSIYVSVYPCLFQLDYSMGRLVSMLQINFSLPTKNTKSIIRNRIRDNNLFSFFAKSFYSNIMSEYNYTTELKGIIQDQIKKLRKTPIPQLPNFDDAAASVLDVYWLNFLNGFVLLTDEYIIFIEDYSALTISEKISNIRFGA